MTGKTGTDAFQVLGAIESAVTRGYLKELDAIKLLKLATGNKDWSEKDRADAFKRVGLLAGRMAEDEAAYIWLFDVTRTHAEVANRRAAARAYSADHYPAWRAALDRPDLPFGAFGENLTAAGLAEAQVCIGDAWTAGR